MMGPRRQGRGRTSDREDNSPHRRLAGPLSWADDPGDGADRGGLRVQPAGPLLVQELIDRVVTRGRWDAPAAVLGAAFRRLRRAGGAGLVDQPGHRPDRPGSRPRPAASPLRPAPEARPGLLRQDPQRGDPLPGDGRRRRDPGVRDRPDLHDPDRPGNDRGHRCAAALERLAAGGRGPGRRAALRAQLPLLHEAGSATRTRSSGRRWTCFSAT